MSSVSALSNSAVEVDSDSSNDKELKKDYEISEHKFIFSNEFYKSLLANTVLGKNVLNSNINLKGNFNTLDTALKEIKDGKGLTVSSVPVFPRNLTLHRENPNEKASFAWTDGGEEGGGGGGGGGGNSGGTGSGGTDVSAGSNGTNSAASGGGIGTSGSSSTGLAHWVSVMAEHIHNPHSTSNVTGVHHQQTPPQAPYPWNNGLSTDQCNPHDKESDYWCGTRGAKQGYEHFLLQAKMNTEHVPIQKVILRT